MIIFAAPYLPRGLRMPTQPPKQITRLLVAWGEGDEAALEELTPLVYGELHRPAHHYKAANRERSVNREPSTVTR